MLSLELIDSGLVIARRRDDAAQIVVDAPGVALLEDQGTQTGAEAAPRLRVNPLLAHTNFWRGLSTETLAPVVAASSGAKNDASTPSPDVTM